MPAGYFAGGATGDLIPLSAQLCHAGSSFQPQDRCLT
jgi:hypothetical protein